uniref:Uncharacterized protein n=1 Tax=Rhizophora mucronata TaxID=61149 RepID=A0A2P2NFP0_RHIMU
MEPQMRTACRIQQPLSQTNRSHLSRSCYYSHPSVYRRQ